MTILLIDNDEDFRQALAENLRDDGHRVLEYPTPVDVPLDQLEGVDLTITDYLMNGEDGLAFANRFHRSRPGVPVVLVTAYATKLVEQAVKNSGFLSLLHKPLDYGRMERLITDLTGYRPA